MRRVLTCARRPATQPPRFRGLARRLSLFIRRRALEKGIRNKTITAVYIKKEKRTWEKCCYRAGMVLFRPPECDKAPAPPRSQTIAAGRLCSDPMQIRPPALGRSANRPGENVIYSHSSRTCHKFGNREKQEEWKIFQLTHVRRILRLRSGDFLPDHSGCIARVRP